MNLTQKNIFLIIAGIALASRVGIGTAEETAAEKPGYLEPEIVGWWCNGVIGKHMGPGANYSPLGIKRIPGVDDALDNFTKISPIDVQAGFTLANMYLWRGQNLGGDTSWMPYVTISPDFEPLGDLCFTYWADATQHTQGTDHLEDDLVIQYCVESLDVLRLAGVDDKQMPYLLKKTVDFSFKTGYTYYWFPKIGDNSEEVYFGITYNLPLKPSITAYNDYRMGRGVWWEWGISQDFDLKLFTVCTFATLGYNHRQWGETSALSTFVFGGSIPISLGSHMTVAPFLSYSKRLKRTFFLDDEGNRADLTHDELYGGMNYSIAF